MKPEHETRRKIIREWMSLRKINDKPKSRPSPSLRSDGANPVQRRSLPANYEVAADAGLANYLLKQPHGGEAIRTMIIDDIHKALDEGRIKHAAVLFMALQHFLDQNPDARVGLATE